MLQKNPKNRPSATDLLKDLKENYNNQVLVNHKYNIIIPNKPRPRSETLYNEDKSNSKQQQKNSQQYSGYNISEKSYYDDDRGFKYDDRGSIASFDSFEPDGRGFKYDDRRSIASSDGSIASFDFSKK